MAQTGEPAAGGRIDKSASAYRTTGEAAEELYIPPHVLRFWEAKFPQIKPLKRGGGRRYYRPEDLDLLRRIRRYLYQEGYTIRGVQKLLREGEARGGAHESAVVESEAPQSLLAFPAVDGDTTSHDPAAGREVLRAALAGVERELLEIRALLAPLLVR